MPDLDAFVFRTRARMNEILEQNKDMRIKLAMMAGQIAANDRTIEEFLAALPKINVTEDGPSKPLAHVHTRQCYDDPGPGHGSPSLICGLETDTGFWPEELGEIAEQAEKVLSCPRCKSSPCTIVKREIESVFYWRVECMNCGERGREFTAIASAVENWNAQHLPEACK
jgi:hypothetical protein